MLSVTNSSHRSLDVWHTEILYMIDISFSRRIMNNNR